MFARLTGAASRLRHVVDEDTALDVVDAVASWLVEHPDTDSAVLRRVVAEVASDPSPLQRVAALPTGEVWSVLATAVGVDEHGEVWIDPLATVRRGGYPEQDPRVERLADGRIRVDTSRLTGPMGPRKPSRHRTSATPVDDGVHDRSASTAENGENGKNGELTALYAATVVEIAWADGETFAIGPNPPDADAVAFPDGVDVIHVLTAANPRSRLLTPAENEERNRVLARQLAALDLEVRPAIGRASDDSWQEASFAIIDTDDATIAELAALHEQTAFFTCRATGRRIVWTNPFSRRTSDASPPGPAGSGSTTARSGDGQGEALAG